MQAKGKMLRLICSFCWTVRPSAHLLYHPRHGPGVVWKPQYSASHTQLEGWCRSHSSQNPAAAVERGGSRTEGQPKPTWSHCRSVTYTHQSRWVSVALFTFLWLLMPTVYIFILMLLNLYLVNLNDYASYLAGMITFRHYSFSFFFFVFSLKF